MLFLIESKAVTPFGSKWNIENYLNSLKATKFKKIYEVRDEHDFIVDYFLVSDRRACKGPISQGKYIKTPKEISDYVKQRYPRCSVRVI